MRLVLRWIRRFFLWIGPALVLLLVVVCGFGAWIVGSEPGTRWALRTAVQQVDGNVSGVEGSIWRGVRIGSLAIKVPVVSVELQNLYLQVNWRELAERRLHAQDLSVDQLDIDILQSSEKPPSSTPFTMPVLPVGLALDRIALGELNMRLNGEPILLSVQNLMASLAVTQEQAQLVFKSLKVGGSGLEADIEGEVKVLELADPWPLEVRLKTRAQGLEPNSLLCVRRFLPDLPAVAAVNVPGSESKKPDALSELSELSAACAVDVDASISGSMQRLDVVLAGKGQDVQFDVNAHLLPRASFPLQDANIALMLADGSSLHGKLAWDATVADNVSRDRVVATLKSDKLNLGQLVGSAIPPAIITTSLNIDAQLLNHRDLLSADIKMDIAPESSWNKQKLSGVFAAKVINASAVPTSGAQIVSEPIWKGLQLADLNMDLRLGTNHLRGEGALGTADSRLKLDVAAARLADFWPDLPGGLQLRGQFGGTLPRHSADLNVVYTFNNGKA
ncbi:MAG TPA: DUF490 domain-containing protein, partial [Eoetvoesiella sp.]